LFGKFDGTHGVVLFLGLHLFLWGDSVLETFVNSFKLLLVVIFVIFGSAAISFCKEATLVCPLPDKYTTYGPFDKNGIPMRDFGGTLGVVYHPLVVAEFASYYDYLYKQTGEGKYLAALLNMSNWLVKHQNDHGYWEYEWDNSYEGVFIAAPWVSAVTQGFGAQSLLKGYAASQDKSYLEAARKAIVAMEQNVGDGGVRFKLARGCFYEEMPSNPPTHILNGHLTALQAMWEFLELAEDEHIHHLFDEGIEGLKYLLVHFDTGYWSKYDLLMTAIDVQKLFLIVPKQVLLPEITASISGVHIPLKFQRVENSNFKSIEGTSFHRKDVTMFAAQLVIPPDLRDINLAEGLKIQFKNSFSSQYKMFVSWPEEKTVLLPISAKEIAFIIPSGLLGHRTGVAYHNMVIQQLLQLFKVTGDDELRQYAQKWKAYFEQYNSVISREEQ